MQEYEQALEKLRNEYYRNETNETNETIIAANVDLMSDLVFGDSVIKAVVLQTIANTNGIRQNGQQKNTFLYRSKLDSYEYGICMNEQILIYVALFYLQILSQYGLESL